MNVVAVIVVLALTVTAVFWLTGKCCFHKYEIIDQHDTDHGTERVYVQRCTKCGKILTKKVGLV